MRAKAIVPRRVTDRLGEEALCALVEEWRTGAKARDLAEHYQASDSSLKRLLRAASSNLQPAD